MVLAIGYLLMTIAGATHELDHMKSRMQRQSQAAHQAAASPDGRSQTVPIDPAKDTLCFFCALGTTVLLVVAFVLSFIPRLTGTPHVQFTARRRTLPPVLGVISLRAPPALA
jgi:hypothetical protein